MKILFRIWAGLVWIFTGGNDDSVQTCAGQTPPVRSPPSPEISSKTDEQSVVHVLNVPGDTVEIGGKQWILAPLNAAATKQYQRQIREVGIGALPDVELVAKLAYMSLRRNYPDITIEYVESIVDYGNFLKIWETLLNVTGLVAQAGEMMRRMQVQMEAAGLKA